MHLAGTTASANDVLSALLLFYYGQMSESERWASWSCLVTAVVGDDSDKIGDMQ